MGKASMNLDDLQRLAERLDSRSKEMDAFGSLLNSISTALSELLEHLESRPASGFSAESLAQLAKTLADALPKGQPAVNVAAPAITVEPTPVMVNVDRTPVHVQVDPVEPWKQLLFEVVDYDGFGIVKTIRVTRN